MAKILRSIPPIVLAVLAGCGSPPPLAVTKCQATTILPRPAMTDILFVVDDSGSMAAEQANLARSFDAFIAKLASSPVRNDFQIGVTTTSVDAVYEDPEVSGVDIVTTYDDGKPYPAGALVAKAGRPKIMAASSATLIEDFKDNVDVGTEGSSKEQGLRAALLAVTDRVTDGTNAGFLRAGARLALIIVSDEDDCSDPYTPPHLAYPAGVDACHSDEAQAKLMPVSEYQAALQQRFASERRDVFVALVAGVDPTTKEPVQPACNEKGYQAKRYRSFVDAFPGKSFSDDVCRADFTSTLEAIAGLIDPGQRMELSETPADGHLLVVSLQKASGARVSCTLAVAGEGASEATADVIFTPAQGDQKAALSFQRACRLEQGDSVDVRLLCAG